MDSTGSIYVAAYQLLPLHVGSLVDIVGVSGAGDYAPIVDRAHVQVIGEGHLPENAPLVTMGRMLMGVEDGQFRDHRRSYSFGVAFRY